MRPFHEEVSRIRWGPERIEDYTVGYADRVLRAVVELPLGEFLASEIPHHRARYLRRGDEVVWDRRRPEER